MARKISGIYKIVNPKGKVYVGQSTNIERRKAIYAGSPSGFSTQPKLYNSIQKYGFEAHSFILLEECAISLLNQKERYYQDKFQAIDEGLNCIATKTNTKSGYFSKETKQKIAKAKKGYKFSEEAKKKMSEAAKGRLPWNKGLTGILTQEHLAKMKEGRSKKDPWNKGKKYKGPTRTQEHKETYSAARKLYWANNSMTQQTKDLISKNNKRFWLGKKLSPEHLATRYVSRYCKHETKEQQNIVYNKKLKQYYKKN